MIPEIKRDIREMFRGRIIYNDSMRKHTSFRIGGCADIWVEPADIDDLRNCLRFSRERNIPIFIMGGGTNLLVSDEGIRGIVVNMQAPPLKNIFHGDRKVSVTSSVTLAEFMRFCISKELEGLEFLAGVPGSIGGAVATNAGARRYDKVDEWKGIGDFIEEIRFMNYNGETDTLTKSELNFDYKSAGLKDIIILEAKFLLAKSSRETILDQHRKFLERKKKTQELGRPSAGCIFRNPTDFQESAGELIDRCGLKGKEIGGAAVSRKHANFIVNKGNATAKDVKALIEIIKNEVRGKFGVELALEIEIV